MLYEHVANDGILFPKFSDVYLVSDFCKRAMDTDYSRFQLQHPGELLDFIIPENPGIDEKFPDGQHFDGAVAYWIGFMYRYLSIAMGISSKELLQRYSFGQMCAVYPGMHTVDYDMAADMIVGN